MQDQQQVLLRSAAANTAEIVSQAIKDNNAGLRETIDEVASGSMYDDVIMKNNINRNNFDFCKQVDAIWKKTERAITEGQLEKASGLCQQGKKLTTKRLKVLRIADKDGWDTALAYISDELASGS